MKLSFAVSMQDTSFNPVAKGDCNSIAAQMADIGYNGLELAIKNPFSADISQIENLLKKTGLRVCAIGTGQAYLDLGISLTSPDIDKQKKAVSYIRKHIEIASNCQALVIIGLIRGKLSGHPDPSKALEICGTSLRQLCRYADRFGVTLVIEPVNRYETDFIHTASEAITFIKNNDLRSMGVLLDTFHMNIEEQSFGAAIKNAAGYLKHVHIADSNRRYPGSGHLNLKEIINMFSESGYDGFFSGEMVPEPDLKTAATRYYNFMRN